MNRKLRNIGKIARRKSEEIVNEMEYGLIFEGLCGFCARGSAILFNELKKRGYEAKIVEGDGHFYVECEGYIIDVTATQFGPFSTVVVRKSLSVSMQSMGYWKPYKKYNSIESARRQQRNDGWPIEQTITWSDILEN